MVRSRPGNDQKEQGADRQEIMAVTSEARNGRGVGACPDQVGC